MKPEDLRRSRFLQLRHGGLPVTVLMREHPDLALQALEDIERRKTVSVLDLFTELGARLWEEMRGKKDRLEAACEQLDNAGINVKRGLYEEGRVLVDEINRLAARKPVNAVDARKPITTFTGGAGLSRTEEGHPEAFERGLEQKIREAAPLSLDQCIILTSCQC